MSLMILQHNFRELEKAEKKKKTISKGVVLAEILNTVRDLAHQSPSVLSLDKITPIDITAEAKSTEIFIQPEKLVCI